MQCLYPQPALDGTAVFFWILLDRLIAHKRHCTFSACNIPSKESHGRIVEFLTEPSLTALLQQPDPFKPKDLRNLVFMILMYDTAARCSELRYESL